MQIRSRVLRFCRFSLLLCFGILLVFLALKPQVSHAYEDFSYNIKVNYDVQNSGNTHVTETYTITNNISNKYLESLQLSTPTDEVNNLSVRYSDGTPIAASSEKQKTDDHGYSYEFQQVNVKFTRQSVGFGVSTIFIVSYDTTKLVESKGQAHAVYIPAIASDNAASYSVSLTVPAEFGPVHGVGAALPTQTQLGNKRQFGISNQDLRDHSIALLFGDYTVYEANFNFPLKNDTNLTKVFSVALPPNMPSQEIYVNKLDPAPVNTSLDTDGNIIAEFSVPANTNITVKTNVISKVKFMQYDLAKSGAKTDIPRDLTALYTRPTKYWQSTNPNIKKKAQELTQNKKTVAEQIQAINDYVIDTLSYNNDKIKYNIRQGALQALSSPSNAVCLEYSDLTIALLRAAGIPARMPIGYGYTGNLKTSRDVADSLHSWVEAYAPGIGWMNVDPTWGEKYKNFGYSDLDHFAFALWGVDDNQPMAVTQNEQATDYQYADTKLSYTTFQPTVAQDAQISATKWVVLPFVSIITYRGRSVSNMAASDLVVSASTSNGKTQRGLGNLAPSQTFWGMLGDFGQSFVNSSQVDLYRSGSSASLATSKTSQNYIPITILSVVIIVIIILKMLQYFSKQAESKRPAEPRMHKENDQPTKTKR